MIKYRQLLSYVLVAALASAISLFAADTFWNQNRYSKLNQLSALIDECFIGEADWMDYEDAAAAAMVDALGDEWSYYIPASQMQEHRLISNNTYVGIGISYIVRQEQDGFYVNEVNADGPAAEAGMLPGDVIVEIEGQSAAGMTAAEARNLIQGELNTQVQLKVRRGDEIIELSVTRKEVPTSVATGQMLDGNIGLIIIEDFDARCYDESRAAIEQLLADGAEALIFDIRFNHGGYKDEMVALLDYLLPEGPLFHSEDYRGHVEVDNSDAGYLDIPMAVVVNSYSYSAAELFAAAMMEYEAATIVGQQTYGKGYYQTVFHLDDGSAVNLSIGRYTTPRGVNLTGVGITPDIVVEVDDETNVAIYAGVLAPEDDPQIQAAVSALKAN